MSAVAQFLLLASIEVGGLFAIWFLIRARVRRYLELENLLSGVRQESRALVMELNETADRNVSLVEDRMIALRELLDEADRRIKVGKKELATRESEREVYARLSRRRPIVPDAGQPGPVATEPSRDEPIAFSLGQGPEIQVPDQSVIPARTTREEALELYRRGFSPDLIAARTGATVAEIDLIVEMEERRSAARGIGL